MWASRKKMRWISPAICIRSDKKRSPQSLHCAAAWMHFPALCGHSSLNVLISGLLALHTPGPPRSEQCYLPRRVCNWPGLQSLAGGGKIRLGRDQATTVMGAGETKNILEPNGTEVSTPAGG